MTMILLEYNAEQKGAFHWNRVRPDGRLSAQPNTFGWAPIAYTSEDKARIFCNAIDSKNHRRHHSKMSPYTAEHIRKEWKSFCFIFNSILSETENFSKESHELKEHFDSTRSLARLGNGHFSDDKEDNGYDWAWEYNPLNYYQSNYD